MSQLLPAIRKELKIINCHKQFTQVQNKAIVNLLQSLQNHQKQPQASLADRIEKSARKEINKNVFVMMKWYVTLHESIQKARHCYAIERALSLVAAIQNFQPQKKYERYLMEKLVKPYRQYLRKLAQLAGQKIEASEQQQDRQNQVYVYCEYNLLTFAVGQLSASVQQFSGFLKKYYPFLTSYLYLIGRDMSVFYKHIKHAFAKHPDSKLTHFELERLGNSIEIFRKHKGDKFNTWVDIQTDADSEEVSNKSSRSPEEIRRQDFQSSNDLEEVQENWGLAISIIDKYGL